MHGHCFLGGEGHKGQPSERKSQCMHIISTVVCRKGYKKQGFIQKFWLGGGGGGRSSAGCGGGGGFSVIFPLKKKHI